MRASRPLAQRQPAQADVCQTTLNGTHRGEIDFKGNPLGVLLYQFAMLDERGGHFQRAHHDTDRGKGT
jgi:hypothetical protein